MVQLMTTFSGLSFDECYAAREQSLVDGVLVNHLNRQHLLQNKAASGRPQDLADIAALVRKGEKQR